MANAPSDSLPAELLHDEEVHEVVLTFMIDFAILLAVYFFVVYQNSRRGKPGEVEQMGLLGKDLDPLYESAKEGTQVRTPARFQFRSLDVIFGPFLSHFAPLGRVVREAALYLRFHVLVCTFFTMLSIVSITVLVPIYANSTGSLYVYYRVSWLERVTAANLSVASPRLMVSFLAVLMFAGIGWLWMRQYFSDIQQLALDSRDQTSDVTKHTILLTNLPATVKKEERLLKHLKQAFGKGVLACRIASNEAHKENAYGTKQAFVCFASASHARRAIEVFNSGLGTSDNPLSDSIMFDKPDGAFKDKQKTYKFDDKTWRASFAPAPSDVIWSNLHIGEFEVWLRGLAINLSLFVCMSLIIAPVAVIDRLEPLVATIEDATLPDKLKHREVRKFVGNYFPTLVVFVINAILLPFLIDITSHLEGHHAESKRSAEVVRRNAVFQFINTILLPSLALNSAASVIHLAYNARFSDWERIIGTALQRHTSGRFYVIYLIHAALLGSASELSQLPQTAFRILQSASSVFGFRSSSGGLRSEEGVWEFDFGYFYGARLTIMGLVLLYSVLVPFLAPVGAVYFLLNYWTDSYNLRRGVYTVSFDSNGGLPLSVVGYSKWYVALFLLCMSCYFTVQGTLGFLVMGVILLFAAAIPICFCQQVEPVDLDFEDDLLDDIVEHNHKLFGGREEGKDIVEEKGRRESSNTNGKQPNKAQRDRTLIYEFLRSYVCPFQVSTVGALEDETSTAVHRHSPGKS
ncbi:hypothetical protein AAMO2058_000740600 [Amorphochlora amoebiformis]|uniref:CSC1/OSCA1-like 7TM region domain-containing protein n=1 Tax=Amorphochlora amoebiformis TaxID=1561963 RepID=A0A7S0GWV9_9EUKA